ncbi:MAG: hydantoinase/oxoprolinase family protein [Alphaproteobacteria bacterium]|nr:hydantoinase/oxoprolinase family protein [Alphaproteobacteria bacterium]MDG2467596.1 hydantoinase/oxoprolinase family protein [Alphaproteobacteria bacterium]
MRLIGVDVGGTFTDLVLFDSVSGKTFTHKTPTTPHNPSEGVMSGINELCRRFSIDRASVDHIYHGTTTATNTMLEHDGSECGMITNEGYRDIIHIGRHQRPQHFSIQQEIPWQDRPLVKRRWRKTVPHRIAPPSGEVLIELDEDAVRAAALTFKENGINAIAICFLFAFLDPRHEHRARELVLDVYPESFVTCSSDVSPQFREFERFTTTAINAYIGPKVRNYVTMLEQKIADEGYASDLHIMGSNGGLATSSMVAEKPVLTILSGPAAGVMGGAWSGGQSDRHSLITFDVGGTSADIGIIQHGQFAEASPRDTWIAGFPLMVPMIDIHTIGAGGGSIAFRDKGGAFKVGPRSAGARPGPSCYGFGGDQPTVTDANLALGRLIPDNFLGGEMTLDQDKANQVIDTLADELSMDRLSCAEGIITIVNSAMANAIRSRTVQRGLDPREFSLMAFGGGGPLQAAEVAALLAIPEVIVPPYPGITSAIGLLTTDIKYDAIRTAFQVSKQVDHIRVETMFTDMEGQLAKQFHADNIADEDVEFLRYADIRYVGQGYELRVKIDDDRFDAAAEQRLFDQFEKQHHTEYGRSFPDSPKEIVNVRVSGIGKSTKLEKQDTPISGSIADAHIKTTPCVFRHNAELKTFDTAIYQRDKLPLETRIDGPAIILQQDTTTVVRPDDHFRIDNQGNMLISIKA